MVARLANRIKRVVKSRKLEARSNLEEATYDFMTFEENEEHSLPTCNTGCPRVNELFHTPIILIAVEIFPNLILPYCG